MIVGNLFLVDRQDDDDDFFTRSKSFVHVLGVNAGKVLMKVVRLKLRFFLY